MGDPRAFLDIRDSTVTLHVLRILIVVQGDKSGAEYNVYDFLTTKT
jgi:hypothetical protein